MVRRQRPVKNMELWKELDEIALQHSVNWKWVKAHNGNVHNEEALQEKKLKS